MGYIVLGFSLLNSNGLAIGTLYMVLYMFTMLSIFIVILFCLSNSEYIIELSYLKFTNKLIATRNELDSYNNSNDLKVLAFIQVENGKVVNEAGGAKYDYETGVVTFSNPENFSYVPIISDYNPEVVTGWYNYIKSIDSPTKFKVMRATNDQSGRTSRADTFLAIVVSDFWAVI